jgi:amidase
MSTTELWQMEGVEVAKLLRNKKISAQEIAVSQIMRINAVNGKLNAIVERCDEEAIADARKIESLHSNSRYTGMTMTTKINADHSGFSNSNGVKRWAKSPSQHTAPCIQGMIDSGMIMVGRTNAPAMAMRYHTENDLFGETLNPHGIHLTCGGSSGGAASAVAAGMCHVAQGSDVGGSIRFPAYCNGVIGLRPTMGRMTTGGTNPNARGWTAANMATYGPIARTMQDLRAAYHTMLQPNWADPFWTPAPESFAHQHSSQKVALVIDDSLGVDPIVRDTIRYTGKLLENAGYEVIEQSPPRMEECFDLWMSLSSLDLLLGLVPMLPLTDDTGLTTVFENWQHDFPAPTAEVFLKAHMLRDLLIRDWNQFFEQYPLVVLPAYATSFMRRSQDTESPSSMTEIAKDARYMLNIPALAFPAMSFPIGSDNGAPLGVQIAAHSWREDLILNAGDVIEQQLGKISPVDPAW